MKPPMPSAMKTARTILFIQGVVMSVFAIWATLFGTIMVRFEHGQDVGPMMWLLAIADLLVSLTLLATAFWIRAGTAVRTIAIAAESISILFSLVNLFNGYLLGISGIVLAVLVIASLLKPEVEDWYEGEHIGV